MIEYDINEIKKLLAHRYPFLLIDRVISVNVEEKSLVAIKNVTINEPFFTGHFPRQPVMPGVLIVESVAQAACILVSLVDSNAKDGDLTYLTGIDHCRFKRIVVPGDQLELNVSMIRQRGNVCKMIGRVCVDGELACSCELMAHRVLSESS